MTPATEAARSKGYGAGAKILSVGIASTGIVTFAYFSVASHALNDPEAYARISLLWSVLFVIVSVIYRPIEQLLSRTIADRRARGFEADHPLRTPMLIQGGVRARRSWSIALIFRDPIQNELFDGFAALYWVLVIAVLAYAASYFARGWLAGHQWFALYGGLVFIEATARLLFAVAVAGRDRRGAVRGRDGHGGGAVRVARRRPLGVLAPAQGEHAPRSRTSWGSRGAGGSPSPCSRSCWPSRRCSTRA